MSEEKPQYNLNEDGYMTEAQIVEDILANRLTDPSTRASLLNDQDDPKAAEMGISSVAWVMTSFMRWIRNAYGLWAEDNPIRKNWDAERLEHIRNGVDYSPSHPDNISMRILDAVIARLKGAA